MRIKVFKMSLCLCILFMFMDFDALAQWGHPSKSEVQEYIETFVNLGLYAVPYSEPLSVLLSSPEILKMGLHVSVKKKQLKAYDDYLEAYRRGVKGERLFLLAERANRYQALYTCLFANDCTRLKRIESKDMRAIPDPQSTSGRISVMSATYGANCGVKKGNVTSYIAKQCNGKSECRYTVDWKIIGDPAYGCAKTYTVQYQCGDNTKVYEESLSAEAGWGDKAVLLRCR